MKVLSMVVVMAFLASPVLADEYVNGYERSNGTYVQGYERTSPNSTRADNYSATGNVNPYTGAAGHENPYAPSGGAEQRGSGSNGGYGSGGYGSGSYGNGGSAGSLGSYGH